MPTTRKRIGYLPSANAQEMITKIANGEKLSQSKVVGILVEEALIARASDDFKNRNQLIRKGFFDKTANIDSSSLKENDNEELISDIGITYDTKKYKYNSGENLLEPREKYNEELFEYFKQFLLFQKIIIDQ
tara:strand:+ start:610 stop:1005 length:396 start_codon:yes stop_codon:yes gene_type:complete